MASKSAMLEELQSLREELSTARRARKPQAAPSPAMAEPVPTGSMAAAAPDGAADSEKLHDQIGELMSESARFLEEREKDIGAHPLAIAIGGIVVGMIIGRMLGRR